MIDQRLLPHKEVYRVCRNYQEVARAIRGMMIRGAPAIGVAAAMGVALGALKTQEKKIRSRVRTHFVDAFKDPAHGGKLILGP